MKKVVAYSLEEEDVKKIRQVRNSQNLKNDSEALRYLIKKMEENEY